MTSRETDTTDISRDVQTLEKAVYEVKRVIVGQDRLVERILVGLLARGHVLLEGVPGVAKTLAVETFATVVGGSFSRVQFTPDLVPTDLIGTRIYRQGKEEFDTELGPVVANFVLADEINRAPAKVQSALLEVMAERHVSIGGHTYPMPDPFLVMATQNPIENEGVYPLPEAQRDRFLFKIVVDYPTVEEEREIVYRMGVAAPKPKQILDPVELVRLQNVAASVFVHHALVDYVVRVIAATRTPRDVGLDDVAGWIAYGASPRATLGIISASRALAFLRGRDYVVPQDVLDVVPDVLRHRLVLSYDALADEITPEQIITRILQTVGLPQVGAQPIQPQAPQHNGPQHNGPQQNGPQQTGPQQQGQGQGQGGPQQFQPGPDASPQQGGPQQNGPQQGGPAPWMQKQTSATDPTR
ncbi:MoxR family ATPase [Rhodococcus sp. BP-349]|uniref:AAA family ATPase n=1 Tax=unclassified Rhodococcus (in: high G+C Gram-positive bacteria) TaxID=192944 RepID=UPI001C9AC54B|nr:MULTISPECIES: MoxR family ATPase [unclassified Rhodococcus (in: high G+C Gram-positive bacteria)]MBY6541206.1 MoxR family ATPase [Rhodococcus sp. BP-363]MBY6544768.1 MoxR family ATPase [Rhodococcus sp. BP-369]MBY6563998.1 MoxR family ATPase [Rhodococcus sp. BP-370]MBY6579065.1 MoxR family ATPase [Rhodococcus sp. BP-364]MBY6588366.1 MoxR family ATPase [Rhodococcus sp. BP-358]